MRIWTACFMFLVLSGAVLAIAPVADAQAQAGEPVTVTGLNYCLATKLGVVEADIARQDPAKYPHVLQVTEAKKMPEGFTMWSLRGATLHYVFTPEAEPLLMDAEYHDQMVELEGTYFKDENVIIVNSVARSDAQRPAERSGAPAGAAGGYAGGQGGTAFESVTDPNSASAAR